eukprot:1473695-Pyramimonas_sp.AAC.1
MPLPGAADLDTRARQPHRRGPGGRRGAGRGGDGHHRLRPAARRRAARPALEVADPARGQGPRPLAQRRHEEQ